MKTTGIVRRIDELGRVVLPMELRRTLKINEKDPLEIFTDGEKIVLRKYAPGCTFCGGVDSIAYLFGKEVCGKCVGEIAKLAIGSIRAIPTRSS